MFTDIVLNFHVGQTQTSDKHTMLFKTIHFQDHIGDQVYRRQASLVRQALKVRHTLN